MDQAAAWTHAQALSTSKRLPNQQAKLLTGLTSWLGNQICHWASFILPDAQQNQIAKKLVRRGGQERKMSSLGSHAKTNNALSNPPPGSQGVCGICGIANKEAGLSEAWGV